MTGLYRALGVLSAACGLVIVGYTAGVCWIIPAQAFRLAFALCVGVGVVLHLAWAVAVAWSAVPDE